VAVLTFLFVVLELGAGVHLRSLVLLSDGFHNLSDVISLYIAYWAQQAQKRDLSDDMSYGWVRSEILGGLTNGCFLLAICLYVILESIPKFIQPQAIEAGYIFIIVASIGLAVNTIGTIIFCITGQGHNHSHGGGGHSHEGGGHSHEHLHKEKKKKKVIGEEDEKLIEEMTETKEIEKKEKKEKKEKDHNHENKEKKDHNHEKKEKKDHNHENKEKKHKKKEREERFKCSCSIPSLFRGCCFIFNGFNSWIFYPFLQRSRMDRIC